MLVEDAINKLIGQSLRLKYFSLYDDGRLVVSSCNDAHIVMKFETKFTAINWLADHFHKFNYAHKEL